MEQGSKELIDNMLNEFQMQPLKYMARPKEITVEKLFPIGNYLNMRVGMTWSVGDENPNDVMKAALNMANQFHKEHYPHLYNEEGYPLYEKIPQGDEMRGTQVRDIEPEDKIQSWKTVISMCTSITALERFKPAVDREKNQELTQAYNDKLKGLSLLYQV